MIADAVRPFAICCSLSSYVGETQTRVPEMILVQFQKIAGRLETGLSEAGMEICEGSA
jgi:hypothetical protein